MDINELSRALFTFYDSLPLLISTKEDLVQRVTTIATDNFSIEEISLKLQQHKLITREITKLVNSEASRNLDRILTTLNKVRAFSWSSTYSNTKCYNTSPINPLLFSVGAGL